jgi:hypothetical protein
MGNSQGKFDDSPRGIAFSDGSVYVGSFLRSKRDGHGTSTWYRSNGKKAKSNIILEQHVGFYKDDLRHGPGKYRYRDHSEFSGSWFKGYKNGIGYFTTADGMIYEEEWVGGKRISRHLLDEVTGQHVAPTTLLDALMSVRHNASKSSTLILSLNQLRDLLEVSLDNDEVHAIILGEFSHLHGREMVVQLLQDNRMDMHVASRLLSIIELTFAECYVTNTRLTVCLSLLVQSLHHLQVVLSLWHSILLFSRRSKTFCAQWLRYYNGARNMMFALRQHPLLGSVHEYIHGAFAAILSWHESSFATILLSEQFHGEAVHLLQHSHHECSWHAAQVHALHAIGCLCQEGTHASHLRREELHLEAALLKCSKNVDATVSSQAELLLLHYLPQITPRTEELNQMFPLFHWRISSQGLSDCTICFGEFNDHANCMMLPCMHYFHADCIIRWWEESRSCPLCRLGRV